MKNSSRGRPIRSTSSLVTRTPLKGITIPSIRSFFAARRTSSTACTTRVLPGRRMGNTRRSGSASSTTRGPQKSRLSDSTSSWSRQSTSGRPSSSISHTRSASRSIAHASPSWKPPAPPRLVVRVRPLSGTSPVVGRAASHSPVPSDDALSTTSTSARPSTCPRRSTSFWSSAEAVEGDHDRDDAGQGSGGHGVHTRGGTGALSKPRRGPPTGWRRSPWTASRATRR